VSWLNLTQLMLEVSRITLSDFKMTYPHPVLVPEKVRSGLLESNNAAMGGGTLVLSPGDAGGGSGGTTSIFTPRVQVVEQDSSDSNGVWVTLGRTAESDVMVNDFSVSTRHARIRPSGESFLLEDVGSKNGTLLDGVRAQPNTPTALQSGQTIQLGRVTLLFLDPAGLHSFILKDMLGRG